MQRKTIVQDRVRTFLSEEIMIRSTLLISAMSFALSGCASLYGASSTTWPWKAESNICAGTTCSEAEALKAYVAASSFCRDVQNYYESGGQRTNSTKVAIGAVGTLAGSVVAPIANGTAAKAWSGLSGATNAVQLSLDEAFAAAVTVKRRAAVSSAAADGASAYAKAADANKRVLAAVDMARLCAMGSAEADKAAVKALTDQ